MFGFSYQLFNSIFISIVVLVFSIFRSIGKFSVNKLAKTHFNCGGHKNAAGGRLDENLDVALSKFLNVIKQNRSKLIY